MNTIQWYRKENKMRMKTTATLLIATFMISTMAFAVSAIAKKDYATIQDGTITDTKGNPITVGYDKWGYNYQAHMFYGFYDNYARPDIPVTEGDTMLMMKWGDSWLSNKDRDGDNKLDRGNEGNEYANSAAEGAWLTNHQWGVNEDGTKWYYFVKIVFPGYDVVYNEEDDTYYTEEGVEIGTALWGAYARIQQVSNDPSVPEHGCVYNPPSPTGFGYYK